MQSLRHPITRAVPDLIPYLGSSPTTYTILGLEWYEYGTPTKLNFVILEVARAEYSNLWLRMDRTVGLAGLLRVSRNTDRAHLCDLQDLLIDINVPDDHIHCSLATAFRHPPPLNKLGVLLSVLLRESPRFSQFSADHSYFYCLAIYENLVELGEGEYIAHGAPPQLSGILAQEALARVKMRMQKSQNGSNWPSSSLTNLQQSPAPPLTDARPGPAEAPNLTGRIVRLGSAPIATGGYSSVWRGSLPFATPDDPNRSLPVAIKVLRASHTDEHTAKRRLQKRLHSEMRIWARLHHENVVTLLGHTQEPEGPGLVSISYRHGNVLSFLAKNPSVNREIITLLWDYNTYMNTTLQSFTVILKGRTC
ncbi:hypothetical protein BS47DRAFT_538256 [Hydnum rufescens UP504]|uniref:Serine-threonine/tyrosine-protein kinase catalytic domain-containing protein n=1 Tax=Hydnum rufescens UP504 TaxID=1448309 RepID=A0A9P6AIB5_9AGAM|nr:hypothetical protein BS47DRAFT_538256 [Hydnum rufescens UP504]